MILTDTHTHLYLPEFDNNRSALIADAIGKSVSAFLLPNINSETIQMVFNTAEKFPKNCFPMMGLHPCDVKENYRDELDILFQYIDKEKKADHGNPIYGIGEIGLDYYWDKTFLTEQAAALIIQLNWSRQLNLPVSLHTRNATQETIDLIREVNSGFLTDGSPPKVSGVFHCFGGTLSQAQDIIGMDMYIGIGGVVTFKNSGLDKLVEQIPLDKIVLETDSPYLAPAPQRGKQNLPEYLLLIANKIAEIKNISLEEVARVTTKNAALIFNLPILL